MINLGHGVSLRTIDLQDLPRLRKWRNSFAIWKWCRQNDLINTENHESWYKKQAVDKSVKMYGIVDPHHEIPDRLVGVCGLTDIDLINRRAEFSLYIDPTEQNKGYGSKALKTLFHHGFMNLGLNCIWGETFEGNPAGKMFEKIGMKVEGSRRDFYFREGKFIPAHLYSILRSDWDHLLQAGSRVYVNFITGITNTPWVPKAWDPNAKSTPKKRKEKAKNSIR